MHPSVRSLVKPLRLMPHPEGGFYREIYRSPLTLSPNALPRRYKSARRSATSILYLLPAGACSRWHRIKSDELWSFHLGGPLQLCEISTKGRPRCTLIGPRVDRRQVLQHVVPAGSWFAAKPMKGNPYALVGCVVSPGFTFKDFELGDPSALARSFPRLKALITQYT